MKYWGLILSFITFISVSCSDEAAVAEKDCVPVKLIVEVCGQAVFQFQNEADQKNGESYEWDGVTYPGCFYSEINCTTAEIFRTQKIQKGSTFNLKIVDKAPEEPTNCAVCLALLGRRPQQSYFFIVNESCR